MLIKGISEIREEVGLDYVDPMGITEVLESVSHPQDNEDEDRGTKEMQTKDLTDVLFTIDMAAEKLCDIDPGLEHSPTVERGIRAMLHPYYENLLEKRKNQNS
jgi:hypothetical protein